MFKFAYERTDLFSLVFDIVRRYRYKSLRVILKNK